jgi:hypothetical protein
MQEEVDAARRERGTAAKDEPWAGKVTWSKVGGRLGYSRQRIHQLIQLLDLPEEIRDAVRDGQLSERDTRVYQGLTTPQQRALHRARMSGDLDANDVRTIARLLREAPDMTVSAATRLLRAGGVATADGRPPTAAERPSGDLFPPAPPRSPDEAATAHGDPMLPARVGAPTSIMRLDWVRGHLARVDRQGLTPAERREMLRLLRLIREDVASLITALENYPSD